MWKQTMELRESSRCRFCAPHPPRRLTLSKSFSLSRPVFLISQMGIKKPWRLIIVPSLFGYHGEEMEIVQLIPLLQSLTQVPNKH